MSRDPGVSLALFPRGKGQPKSSWRSRSNNWLFPQLVRSCLQSQLRPCLPSDSICCSPHSTRPLLHNQPALLCCRLVGEKSLEKYKGKGKKRKKKGGGCSMPSCLVTKSRFLSFMTRNSASILIKKTKIFRMCRFGSLAAGRGHKALSCLETCEVNKREKIFLIKMD